MSNAIFIDTWGWLTLNDAGERRHNEVASLYHTLIADRTIIYTSTFVLDETFTLFFKRLNSFQAKQAKQAKQAMLQLSEAFSTEQFQLIQIDEFRFSQTQLLRLKYLDKPQISFTDLTSALVMQELNIHRILTEDAHFTQIGLGFKLEPNSPILFKEKQIAV